MRIVFCGTASFALPSLRACVLAHQVAAVVTQPSRPGSRGRPAPRPLADAAREMALPLLQPERIRTPEAVAGILDLGADTLVVAAYGQIIPTALLDGHRYGGVNVHASLLPRWRGAAPVARALLAGDPETGVCVMRMEAGLDTGPVYASRRIAVERGATAPALTEALAAAGAQELLEVLGALERGMATATPQPEAGVTLAPRLGRDEGLVEWVDHSALQVDRMVRALDPWPGVHAPLAGVRVRILSGEGPVSGNIPADGRPGTAVRSQGESVVVATCDGLYRIDTLQPPGRRPMTAAAFLRGRR
ncbi:MAG: methionyl-tRNA formyltransferase [Candidatus Dormibacteria bacterium]